MINPLLNSTFFPSSLLVSFFFSDSFQFPTVHILHRSFLLERLTLWELVVDSTYSFADKMDRSLQSNGRFRSCCGYVHCSPPFDASISLSAAALIDTVGLRNAVQSTQQQITCRWEKNKNKIDTHLFK